MSDPEWDMELADGRGAFFLDGGWCVVRPSDGWRTRPYTSFDVAVRHYDQGDLIPPGGGPYAGEVALPPDARPARCRQCGAAIVWQRAAGHRPQPLDLATRRDTGHAVYVRRHVCPDGRRMGRANATDAADAVVS